VLLHAIRDLERHGIDAAASVPLPKIVVVGDQSAGKSSLIEAISEITVPRVSEVLDLLLIFCCRGELTDNTQDSGTCTRCVLHISLRDEPRTEWRCDVSLVQKYFHAPHIGDSELYPWADMEQEVTSFVTVHDKKDLENVIRRAQLAVLNPSQNPLTFRKKVSNTSTEVSFSPNIISLEISAPNLPNLSFYDLPGRLSPA
jgi:GTPase SAR1 family protein